jgi:hypothetical protein
MIRPIMAAPLRGWLALTNNTHGFSGGKPSRRLAASRPSGRKIAGSKQYPIFRTSASANKLESPAAAAIHRLGAMALSLRSPQSLDFRE